MNSRLQKRLFKKYPKIFMQKDLHMTKTCMCWGIETGDGWYWLIDQLCSAIQNYIDNNNYKVSKNTDDCISDELADSKKEELVDRIPQVEAVQVKEKFGGLRFYFDGGDDFISGMVSLAENMSYKTCEWCGSTTKVSQTSGWVISLCSKCMGKHKRSKTLLRKRQKKGLSSLQ